jgi:hypothetical protein
MNTSFCYKVFKEIIASACLQNKNFAKDSLCLRFDGLYLKGIKSEVKNREFDPSIPVCLY